MSKNIGQFIRVHFGLWLFILALANILIALTVSILFILLIMGPPEKVEYYCICIVSIILLGLASYFFFRLSRRLISRPSWRLAEVGIHAFIVLSVFGFSYALVSTTINNWPVSKEGENRYY